MKFARVYRLMAVLSCALIGGGALAASSGGTAGDPWMSFNTPTFEHEILPEGNVQAGAIAQTSDGLMWFGTAAGLVRYDGYRARVYDTARPQDDAPARPEMAPLVNGTAPDAAVSSLMRLDDGGLLVGTLTGGLMRFDPRRDVLVRLGCLVCGDTGLVTDIAPAADGGAWVTGADGVDHVDLATGQVQHYTLPSALLSSRTYAVFEDEGGVLWVGGHPGLYRRPAGAATFRRVLASPALAPADAQALSGDVISFYQDGDRRLWAGTRDGRVLLLDKASGQPLAYPGRDALTNQLQGHAVTSLIQPCPDTPELLWIATDGLGVFELNTATGAQRHFIHDPARPTSLASDYVAHMLVGRTGNVWLLTGSGINRFDASQRGVSRIIAATPLHPGLSDETVLSILVARDRRVWLGLAKGWVDVLDPATGAITPVRLPGAHVSRDVRTLVELPDGDVLAGGDGVVRIDHRTLTARPIYPQLSAYSIRALSVSMGRLRIGTYDGMLDMDLSTGQISRPAGGPDTLVDALLNLPGSGLWLGGPSGLAHFDGVAADAMVTPVPLRREGPGARPGRTSIAMLSPGPAGGLLVATRGGEIGLIEPDRALDPVAGMTLAPLRAVPFLNQWVDHRRVSVSTLLADDVGHLWGSVDDKVFTTDTALDGVRVLGRRQGVMTGTFSQGAAALASDGTLLFGGQQGLTVVHPDRLSGQSSRGILLITGLSVNYATRQDLIPRPGATLTLEPDWRALRLEFALLDYRYPRDLHYAYRLEGFDHTWVPSQELPQATYTNLPPGSYIFRVRAWDEAMDSPLAEMAVYVEVTPHWYETVWIKVLGAFAVMAAVALFVAWRTDVHRHRQTELARIVGERTRDLREANRKLERLAGTDSLTGLLNRRRFFDLAEAERVRARRYGRQFSVIMMDIDHFKSINDAHGHVVGDEVLRHVVAVATGQSRMMDLTARYGGEEMVFLLPETGAEGAFTVAERIRETLAVTPMDVGGQSLRVTASLGVAEWRGGEESLQEVIERADEALYRAKSMGRDRTVLSNDGPGGPGCAEADDAPAA